MKDQTRTQVFPLTEDPVHEGVYEVEYNDLTKQFAFSRWQNGQWHLVSHYLNGAIHAAMRSNDMYWGVFIGWRGFVEKQDD